MARVEDILNDADATVACKQLLECYNDDLDTEVLTSMPDLNVASASFLLQLGGKSADQVKDTLENLSHAMLIVKALRYKAIMNSTGDIIKTLGEVNELMANVDDVFGSIYNYRQVVDSRYGRSISLYNDLNDFMSCLQGICNLQSYVIGCIDLLSSLRTLMANVKNIGNTLLDFVTLLNTANQLGLLIMSVNTMQPSIMINFIARHCYKLKTEVINVAYDGGIRHLIRRAEASGGDSGGDQEELKVMAVCNQIFRELDVTSECSLRLVDEMVAITGRCINLRQLKNSELCKNMWQPFFISQLAEFMAKYKSCLLALYTFCRSMNYRVGENLDEHEQEVFKSYLLLSQNPRLRHNTSEQFAACELYAKRSVGLLKTALGNLESQSTSDRSDIVMMAPQLMIMGECTHAELQHLKIHFNLQAFYFKTICENYAKDFMTIAAQRLLPESKTVFMGCIRVLQQNNVQSMNDVAPEYENRVASALLRTVPSDDAFGHMIVEFLEKSYCCDTLHQHVLQVANVALQNVLAGVQNVATSTGSRLTLSDGGSKISLRRPTDAHHVNIRLQRYLMSLVTTIEPSFIRSVDRESQLFHTLQTCKSINLTERWPDDVGKTLWHTVSYVSSGGCNEFGWFVHQVLTATQHMLKMCKFLRENYFSQLPHNIRMNIFRRVSTHAISSFIIYAITVWPLEEDDKMSFLGVMTELEMELAEISNESLPKLESDYLLAFRRLIYLGDELFDMIKSPDFQTDVCLWLPVDVISLHVITRIVNNAKIPHAVREELSRFPLYKFMGEVNIHATLSKFHSTMLNYKSTTPTIPMFGRTLAQYLKGFTSLEHLLHGDLANAFHFLETH
ncbi:hypothetical protein BaOVIS_027200 [Babesia ovis]|uniref:Uncharacterized protein n=1 Tax=Babesia ovis TaxID=5869 RepID=A0A9W5WVU9_BABOV|nr:hypothetical protein BaOVIS_027200 [Babesia ovis]